MNPTNELPYTEEPTGVTNLAVYGELLTKFSPEGYGAVGNGIDDDRAALIEMDAVGQGIGWPDKTYCIHLDTTLTNGWRANHSIIDGPAGAAPKPVLTINGPLVAGLYQCFGPNVTVVIAAGSVRRVSPTWWGFSTSATSTVNNAAVYAALTCVSTVMGGFPTMGVEWPTGWYKVDDLVWVGDILTEGDYRSTVLENEGTGPLFTLSDTSWGSKIGGFSMVSAGGGILATDPYYLHLENIWAGRGMGGKAYHIKGGLLVTGKNCVHSVNGAQHVPGGSIAEYGFYSEDGPTGMPCNAFLLDNCISEGATVEDYHSESAIFGSGSVWLDHCTLEGAAATSKVKLKNIWHARITDSWLEVSDTAGWCLDLEDVRDSDFSGFLGNVRLTGDSAGNKFRGAVGNVDIGPDCVDNDFSGAASVPQSGFYFLDRGKGTKIGTLIPISSAGTVAGYRNVAGASAHDAALNWNGDFARWNAANTLPEGYSANGGVTTAKETTLKHTTALGAGNTKPSLKLTANGATDYQGLLWTPSAGNMEFDFSGRDGWLAVGAWLYRPAATTVPAQISCKINNSYWITTAVPIEELPEDEWIYVSKALNAAGDIVNVLIGFDNTATGSEILYVADVSIIHGQTRLASKGVQHYPGRFERIVGGLGANTVEWIAGGTPTAGKYYIAGDLIINTTPTAGHSFRACSVAGTGAAATFIDS